MSIINKLGATMPLETLFGGEFPVFYNNILYDKLSSILGDGKNFLIDYKQIIEISNTTAESNYIEAAKKKN